MRTPVAALTTVAVLAATGCAASPASPAVAPPSTPAPHPIVAEATPAPPAAEPGPREEPKNEHATRQMNRALGWVVLSVGVEGAILATVTSFMMLHENSVRSDHCVNKVCSPDGIVANGTLGNLEGWNAAAWGVAAVGLGAGVFLLLTNPSDKSLHAEVGVARTGSGSGMLLRGSF